MHCSTDYKNPEADIGVQAEDEKILFVLQEHMEFLILVVLKCKYSSSSSCLHSSISQLYNGHSPSCFFLAWLRTEPVSCACQTLSHWITSQALFKMFKLRFILFMGTGAGVGCHVREHLVEGISLLLSCRFQGHQAWWQTPLCAEPLLSPALYFRGCYWLFIDDVFSLPSYLLMGT